MDGDGNRVLQMSSGITTAYVSLIEVEISATAPITTSYYMVNGQPLAMRRYDGVAHNIYYSLRDHLGSAGVTVDAMTNQVGKTSYYPYGGIHGNPRSTLHSDDAFAGKNFGQDGFATAFQDLLGGGQPYHFWGLMTWGYHVTLRFGRAATYAHETFWADGSVGRSYQDYALGIESQNLAYELKWGVTDPDDVGKY